MSPWGRLCEAQSACSMAAPVFHCEARLFVDQLKGHGCHQRTRPRTKGKCTAGRKVGCVPRTETEWVQFQLFGSVWIGFNKVYILWYSPVITIDITNLFRLTLTIFTGPEHGSSSQWKKWPWSWSCRLVLWASKCWMRCASEVALALRTESQGLFKGRACWDQIKLLVSRCLDHDELGCVPQP